MKRSLKAAARLVIVGLMCAAVHAQTLEAVVPLPGFVEGLVRVDTVRNKVYVATGLGGNLLGAVDASTNTLVASIPTGGGGHIGMDLNPATGRVYVSRQFSLKVLVVDTATDSVIENIPVPSTGNTIGKVAVNPANNRLYVGREHNADVLVLDGNGTNPHAVLGTLNLGGSLAGSYIQIGVNPLINRIFVIWNNELFAFDGATNGLIARLPLTGWSAGQMRVHPALNRIFITATRVVSGIQETGLIVVDGSAPSILSATPAGAYFLDLDPSDTRVYFGTGTQITAIDAQSLAVLSTFQVPWDISEMGANGSTGRLSVVENEIHNVRSSLYVYQFESAEVLAPTDIVMESGDAGGSATVNFTVTVTGNPPAGAVLTVTDVSAGRTLLSVPATAGAFGVGPVVFPLGSSSIEVRITDGSQVLSSDSFTVQVADTTAPVLAGVEAKTVECLGHATPVTPVTLGISASDAADPHPALTLTPSLLALGANTVAATARDASGNTASSDFVVTVVDTQDPFFTVVPADVSRPCEGPGGATVAFDVRAEDLCGEVTITSVDETGRTVDPAGSSYTVGVHTVTCTATDSSLNSATISFQVTIVDDDDPVLVCPGDITAPTDAGKATAAVSFTVAATDACDTQVSITCTAPWGEVHSGDAFPLGLTTVTCAAQDRSGNEAAGSFRILVVDLEAPVLTAPATANLVTDCAGGALTVTPALLGVTAVDNADPAPRLACTPTSLSPGTTTVDCTATDAAGNVAHASVSVTVLRGPFQVQFLRPLDGAVDNLVKAGQTVPVKVRVTCNNVLDSAATATVDSVTQIDGAGTPVANATVEDSGLSNDSGTTMRLADGSYIYNLSTKGWASASGARFRVRVRVQATGHIDTYAEVVLKNR